MARLQKRIMPPDSRGDFVANPRPSAVLYKLHERLLVQPAQANEVRRSAHAQGA